jgi:phospholipase D1/2
MGGLDLCFGRYDLDHYPLCEPYPEQGTYFPGQDYSNVRIKDFKNVD